MSSVVIGVMITSLSSSEDLAAWHGAQSLIETFLMWTAIKYHDELLINPFLEVFKKGWVLICLGYPLGSFSVNSRTQLHPLQFAVLLSRKPTLSWVIR